MTFRSVVDSSILLARESNAADFELHSRLDVGSAGVRAPFPDGWEQALAPTHPRQQFRKYLAKQPEEVLYGLVALMYMSRDRHRRISTYSVERIARFSGTVRDRFHDPMHLVTQLLDKCSLLEKYLRRSLEVFDERGIDLEIVMPLEPELQR